MVVPDLPGHLQRLPPQVAGSKHIPFLILSDDSGVKLFLRLFFVSSIKQSDKYSQLILTSPSAADTGPYSCWVIVCDGTECEKDNDRAHVSYIYFTGETLCIYKDLHIKYIFEKMFLVSFMIYPLLYRSLEFYSANNFSNSLNY